MEEELEIKVLLINDPEIVVKQFLTAISLNLCVI
ncbi:hypothetical protein D8788_04950 [Streptococcus mitis]|uniref:Uncharacterized protein n=1 Tax=Streptococcus mitis TaxID=28037 RepID=A0A3R9MY71_STRMT|nr:hypothetical protein D8788_04950 [Streptococcus mitis]